MSDAPPLDIERHALFLDFDGTLADFAPTPDAVTLRPGTLAMLEGLSGKLGGALAIVSGRRIADIDDFLAPLVLPASGLHGLEIRFAGADVSSRPPSPEIAEARRRLSDALGPGDRLSVEDKGGALVLHFRQHPEEGERAKALARQAIAGLSALRVVDGHAIAEIRERGIDKAGAVVELLKTSPFSRRLPVYVGDDSTDEDGFRAAAEKGGFGVKVGTGETAAAYHLRDVSAVHRWLSSFA